MSSFTIVAKAGGAQEGAENTCAAIQTALATSPPSWARLAIEVDLRMTADGSLVAMHDASVDRTTNGRGLVRELDIQAVRALSAGPRGERVPLLQEVWELPGAHEVVLDIHDSDSGVAAVVVRALRAAKAETRERVIIASEHARVIHAVRQLDPRVRTAATSHAAWCKVLLERLNLDGWAPAGHLWIVPEVHRGLSVATTRFVASAVRAGDDVWVFVVDNPDDALRLREMGVTGCFTTRPARLSAALHGPSTQPLSQ